ncbi:MAG: S1/P1 nuclease [Tepidisphaeraceae bacterium]
MRFSLALACMVLGFAANAFGWGGEGHQVVCLIAENHLTDNAKAGIHELLGEGVNISDAEVANWADRIRRERGDTGPWHYVNIPLGSKGYDEQRDGKKGDNVIDRIRISAETVNDRSKSKRERATALRFLVHLVGDVSQPLHCVDNNDAGGNKVVVQFLNQQEPTNLHSVWDTALIRQYIGKMSIAEYADSIDRRVKPADAQREGGGTPAEWANQGFGIASAQIYTSVPEGGATLVIDQRYIDNAKPIVESQLARGGFRLANVLNAIFR